MGERKCKVKVMTPTGPSDVDGTAIDPVSIDEKWSEYKLPNGDVIKVKQSLIEIIRLDEQHDLMGNQMYTIQAVPVIKLVKAE